MPSHFFSFTQALVLSCGSCMFNFGFVSVLSSLGCLFHERKTENQTDQSNACYTATSLGTTTLIGQFGILIIPSPETSNES